MNKMPVPTTAVKRPRVLFFDLETSPNVAYIWNKYEQNALGDFVKERMIISIAWKFLGEHDVKALSIPDFYGYKSKISKNRKLIEAIHKLFCAADILVAQNGDNFDIKMANSEFIQYGLKPPPTRSSVDTLKIARQKFRFNSNKLDDIGARLGCGRKIKTGGFDLWQGCMDGDKRAWSKMVKYNKQDVVLLEKIYLKLRPWAKGHPNMNVLDVASGCVVCKSKHIIKKGSRMTTTGKRQEYQCQDCGRWMSGVLVSSGLLIK